MATPEDIFKEGEDLVSGIKQSAEAQTPDVQKLNEESKKLREWSDKKEVKDVSTEKREALAKQIEGIAPTVENIAGADESVEHLKYVQENIGAIQDNTRFAIAGLFGGVATAGKKVFEEMKDVVSNKSENVFDKLGKITSSVVAFIGELFSSRDAFYNKSLFSMKSSVAGYIEGFFGFNAERIALVGALQSVGVAEIAIPKEDDPATQGSFEVLKQKYDTFSSVNAEMANPKDFFAKVALKYKQNHPGETSAKYKHLEEAADEVLREQPSPAVASTASVTPSANNSTPPETTN